MVFESGGAKLENNAFLLGAVWSGKELKMYQKDYVLRQIELMARGIAKLLNLSKSSLEIFDGIISEVGELSGEEYLRYSLRSMVLEGKVNEAEDLLFETVKNKPGNEYMEVALEFYDVLAGMEEEELSACGFSLEEVLLGLTDIKKIFENAKKRDER